MQVQIYKILALLLIDRHVMNSLSNGGFWYVTLPQVRKRRERKERNCSRETALSV